MFPIICGILGLIALWWLLSPFLKESGRALKRIHEIQKELDKT